MERFLINALFLISVAGPRVFPDHFHESKKLVFYDWGICPIVSERDLKSWCFHITLLFFHKQKKERKTPWDKIHCPTVKCKLKD